MEVPDLGKCSRSAHVYFNLRNAILNSELKMDRRLYESSLAELFNASKTPVREALLRLQSERLLVRKGRAYLIRQMDKSQVQQLYQARSAIEGVVMKLLIERCEQLDLSRVNSLIEEMRRVADQGDAVAYSHADVALHLKFANLSGNEFLFETLCFIRIRDENPECGAPTQCCYLALTL